ncbi:CotH kinase family protein [Butyrivibrio proteoclasticus]|uniref:CotH kinase family protein n=1 Tax=Butyrivibrio proteoclasticus TaxID=43305 RepID=UPI00047A290B|nr:CotH kinase family protein [Butyrivibrio proteoclasticus]
MRKDTVKIIATIICLGIVIVIDQNYSAIKSMVMPQRESENDSIESVIFEEAENSTYTDYDFGGVLHDDHTDNHLRDNAYLYKDDNSVITMYLTVREGNASEGTDHTWEEINSYSAYYYDEEGIDRYKAEALLQVGNERGIPEGNLGYGETTPNAIVQIRGQTSSRNPQKNYKIELKPNKGSWNGQTTIALNKHMTDGLRFRNKMGFDLLSGIDELMSLRTQFVHLYVNDLTDGEDEGFEDYGLYTQVEQLNKTALRTHGLDRAGYLYKINFFEFFRYEDVIRVTTDPRYNKDEFEKYLEIKGNDDHTKLITMLEDVNDYGIPIEEVIDKHFDMENLTYYLAFNILTGNYDTQSRNSYLYSPLNEDTWYFYLWDLDTIFRKDENDILGRIEAGSWERGISNYWGNVLFQRCLKSGEFRDALDSAILDVKDYLSREKLQGMVEEYSSIVNPYLFTEPDISQVLVTEEENKEIAEKLPDLVDEYYGQYKESFEKPMPFYIGTPEKSGVRMNYFWDASYDLDQEDISYKVIVARDLECKDIVTSYEGEWTSFTEAMLPAGEYFIKATATNESGYTQDAFDYYETEDGKYYGIKCFYVNLDGSISEYTVTE